MILVGDCRARLRELETESVDSIVTDPPYELGFMGKSWDASGIAYDLDVWRECLRVLKPGGHLLAFSGSRTYHRMVVAIEDAGFEIRDQIMWLYGSGFPKSHDVSKAIDRHGGQPIAWFGPWFRKWREERGINQKQVASLFLSKTGNLTGCVANWELGFNMPTAEQFNLIRDTFGLPFDSMQEAEREVIGKHETDMGGLGGERLGQKGGDITAPATPEAARWQGWGTALKPAHEPICVARKPLRGTVAQNVMAYGTGAINVDGCRVGTEGGTRADDKPKYQDGMFKGIGGKVTITQLDAGRWPANVIHDGSDEVVGMFPAEGRSTKPSKSGGFGLAIDGMFGLKKNLGGPIYTDSGSAARFFYSAKASKADRDEGMEAWEEATPGQRTGGRAEGSAGINAYAGTRGPARNVHPTVKPTDLMRYLVRLVTPPGGLVLDPFTGSGSTGKAAVLEGMRFIGCELSPEYSAIAEARIKAAAVKTGQVFEIPASPAPSRKAEAQQLRLFA